MLAGIKTRHPDRLAREIAGVRERYNYKGEFKFNKVTDRNFERFAEVLEAVEFSDARLMGTVVTATYNPFKVDDGWKVHADLAANLIRGNLNRNEVAVAFLDIITTPDSIAMGAEVKRRVNSRLEGSPLVQAVSLDSECNDLLQVSDMIAGAIRHARFQAMSDSKSSRVKRRLCTRVAETFGADDLTDQRGERVNLITATQARRRRRP